MTIHNIHCEVKQEVRVAGGVKVRKSNCQNSKLTRMD